MPLVVKLIPNEESNKEIKKYLNVNSRYIKFPKEEFHSTIFYSHTTPIFLRMHMEDNIKRYFPLQIIPNSFEVFGEKDLVMKYENGVIQEIHNIIIKEGIKQMLNWGNLKSEEQEILRKSLCSKIKNIYIEFNPHITLAKNFNNEELDKLTKFNQKISFDRIDWTNKF